MSLAKEISDLIQAAEAFAVDVAGRIEQMQALDDETRETLLEYQRLKREGAIALERACGKKQRAIHIGRMLTGLGEQYAMLRRRYMAFGSDLRQQVRDGQLTKGDGEKLLARLTLVQRTMRDARRHLIGWSCADERENDDGES